MDSREDNYRMNRMDYLIVALTKLEDYEFLERTLNRHRVIEYDPLPKCVANMVADILQERYDKINGERDEAEREAQRIQDEL